jgi:hypothetical protein
VSNFDQTPTAKERMRILERGMSTTDQFWQYAKEAILSACDAKTDDDRQGLLELARTWTLAALVQRQSINRASPTACDAGHSPEGFTWRIAIIESVR